MESVFVGEKPAGATFPTPGKVKSPADIPIAHCTVIATGIETDAAFDPLPVVPVTVNV